MTHYHFLEKYSMKCRLYPSKKQKVQLDTLFYGAAAVYNMLLHDLYDYKFCRTVVGKDGNEVHFPDFNALVSKINLDELRHQNECVNYLPGAAISTNNGIIKNIKDAWEKTGKHPIEQWEWKKKNDDGTKQHFGPQYKSKYVRDLSFAYATSTSNIIKYKNEETGKKKIKIKIGSINYTVDGYVKIKGWNESLRFDKNYQTDFWDYMHSEKCPKRIQIRLCKRNDEYSIVFTLNDVYRRINLNDERIDGPGLDLGEITLATADNGDDIKNIFDANPRFKEAIDSIDHLQEVQSKQWGYKNPDFKAARKKDHTIKPSRNYIKMDKRIKRLRCRRNNIIDTYYNQETARLVGKYNKLYMETLDIKGMYWYKDKEKTKDAEKTGENKETDCKA